jgi:DNA-directed RNA polymerase subunit M/transcription elongation factor TFIIS
MNFLDDLPGSENTDRRRRRKRAVAVGVVNIDKPVIYHVLRCPKCKKKRVPVYSKEKESPVRYHKCLDCGVRFKSVEQ